MGHAPTNSGWPALHGLGGWYPNQPLLAVACALLGPAPAGQGAPAPCTLLLVWVYPSNSYSQQPQPNQWEGEGALPLGAPGTQALLAGVWVLEGDLSCRALPRGLGTQLVVGEVDCSMWGRLEHTDGFNSHVAVKQRAQHEGCSC